MFRTFLKRIGLILVRRDPGTVIDFVGNRRKFAIASMVLVAASFLMLLVNHFARGSALNYGTDFKGGTQIQIAFRKVPGLDTVAVRKAMKRLNYKRVTVIKVASGAVERESNTYLIRMESQSGVPKHVAEKLRKAIEEIKDPETGKSLLFRFKVSPAGDSVKLQFEKHVTDEQIREAFAKVQEIRIAESEDAITRPGRPELHKVRVALQGIGGRLRRQLNRELKQYVPRTGKDQYLRFSQNKPFQDAVLAKALQEAGYRDGDQVSVFLGVQTKNILTEEQFKLNLEKAGIPLAPGAGGLVPIGDSAEKRWRLTLAGRAGDLKKLGLKGRLAKAGVDAVLSLRIQGYGAVVAVKSVVAISSKVGRRLRNDGIMSVLIALGLLLVYIGLRFDLKFAPGAVIALAHDVSITMGVFAVAWREFNLDIIAALLTIVGYSLNDTIVVYDRIRENLGRLRDRDFEKVVNISVNETLSRTVLTSFTTFLVVLVILVLARGVIWDFALALAVGIIVGTYSSIFIASPIAIWIHNRWEVKETKGRARGRAGARARKAPAN